MNQEQLLAHDLRKRALKNKKDLLKFRKGPVTKVLGKEPEVPTTNDLKALDDSILMQKNKKFKDFKKW